MAVTVTTDLVVRHAHDVLTSVVAIGGVNAPTANDTAIKVQGTGSSRSRHSATGIAGNGADFTNADISKLHVYVWLNVLDKAETKANGGWRIRIAANGAIITNFGEITVGGSDTQIATNQGFMRFVCDPNKPFDFVTGTPAALTGIGSIGGIINGLTASTRETWFNDSYDTATQIAVKGGTAGDPGKSSQIAANDVTNGRGLFQNVLGAYYVLCGMVIGDTAASSEFADNNEVWIFQDQPVSAALYTVEFVGDAGAGVNNAKFGTKSGTGTATEAAGGNTFKAAGLAPFHIQAIDANIAVGLYGCSFTNPTALRDDAPRAFQFATSVPAFTNRTREAGNATVNDAQFFPTTGATNDAAYFGHEEIFSQLKINVGTIGVGTYTVTWEYWNGTAWTALTDITDGTTNFKTVGTNLVTYAIPDDWATSTQGGLGPYYYIRARINNGTRTTNPLATQIFCVMGGGVRMEQANAEAIRCTFTNMDTIRVRNGAFLKKCTITNSVAPAKSAALDLGSADPAADTVRDLTIQNCSKGILLKGTSVGATTYNFRNLKFSNNTNDVRVDFPAAATITINVLEGGGTPTIDNVNASTVVVNNTVTVKVTVQDSVSFAVIQNVRVLLEAAAGGPLPVGASVTITRVSTTATVAHTAHGMKNGQRIKIKGANQQEYNGIFTIANVSANAYDYTVTGTPATPATGTITSTAVLLSGLTDVNGVIQDTGFNFVSNQPVTGRARKSTAAPFYRPSSIVGDVTSAGFTNVTLLVSDA